MRTKLITVILVNVVALLITVPVLANDEPWELPTEPLMPGRVEGTGTRFELKDSEYLNVFLQSTEEITISLESVPKTISLNIEASSADFTALTIDNSTTLTIGALEPNRTYYKFEDSYKNEVVFVSDENESYSWTQDLTKSHHIWIQEGRGTIFINTDTILTSDLSESVEITADNISLDCNGHSITGSGGTGYGVYLNNREGVIIKNCNLTNFSYGIFLYFSLDIEIDKNNVSNTSYGIRLHYSPNNKLTNNIASSNIYSGISLLRSGDNILIDNTANLNKRYGIFLWEDSSHKYTNDNTLTNNTVNSNDDYGIFLYNSCNNTLINNKVANNNYGLVVDSASYYNTLTGNLVNLNNYGIWLIRGAWNNTLTNNTVFDNHYYGIYLWWRISNTQISNNILSNNSIGIYLNYSSNTSIYHNNLINNWHHQAFDYRGVNNLFDNGYPSGGNYWSDYVGVDLYSGPNQDQPGGDGMGDSPYTFTGGEDRYPFIEESGWGVPPGRIFPDKAAELAKKIIGKDYRYDWKDSLTTGYYQDSQTKKFVFLAPEEIEYLDCSGLSFWSFNRAYYNERESTEAEFEDRPLYYFGANMQYRGNIDRELKLAKEDLRQGNLLFFDTWDRNTETYGQDGIVDHVAMYIGLYEGEEYAVEHAHLGKDNTDNTGKISVTSVDGLIDYYKEKFGEGAFVDFGRVIDRKIAIKFVSHSPIDLIITDPDGETIYKDIGQREDVSERGDVGDSLTMGYMSYDINGDGELNDIVASPERKLGDYLITIVPEPDALPTDTYTLEAEALVNGETITVVLAEDVPISDIPRTPYILGSGETEVIPIIPAFIDFNPDTLNLKSKGKYITVYIELPVGYNINDINLESIRLNDHQVPAEAKPTEIGDYDNNGIPDLMIKFNQSVVQSILETGEEVEIVITGELIDGRLFQDSDIIKVISKGKWRDILGAGVLVFFAGIGLLTYRRKSIFQNNTKRKSILIVILIIILACGGIVGYYWWTMKEKVKTSEEVKPGEVAEEKSSYWKTYRNEEYEFAIDYPVIENWRFRENWPQRTYSSGGKSLFAYYDASLVDPTVFDLILSAQGVVGERYFVDSNCEIFQQKKFLESFSCGLPIGMPFATRIFSDSGVQGYRGNDGIVVSGYQSEGPIRFAIFPLRADFENQHPILLIYYMPPLHPEAMEKFFDQAISTFRFIEE